MKQDPTSCMHKIHHYNIIPENGINHIITEFNIIESQNQQTTFPWINNCPQIQKYGPIKPARNCTISRKLLFAQIRFTEGCIRVVSACYKALTALRTNTSEHGQHLQNSAKATEGLSKGIQGKYSHNHGKKPNDITGSIVYHISLFQSRHGH